MPVIIDGTTGVSLIQDNTVSTSKIVNGAVVTADIADANVTGAKLENSGVTAGTYGSSAAVPVVTIDAKGRVTSATTAALSSGVPAYGAVGSICGLVMTSTSTVLPGGTASGSYLFYVTNAATYLQIGSINPQINGGANVDPRNRTTSFTFNSVNLSPMGAGTWRQISTAHVLGAQYNNDGYGTFYGVIFGALWQRIA